MESKVSYLSTGIKVNKLVKIKDGILPKTKEKNLRLIKRVKKAICFAKKHASKLTNQKN
jgi:hypothetical protein